MRLLRKMTGLPARGACMTVDLEAVVAIDVHTHAEEPCGTHPDDGYDDFQSAMAAYFKSPRTHPPTVPETAAYYRERRIAAVIFPVDAERETGLPPLPERGDGGARRREFRHPDSVRLDRPGQGQGRRARGAKARRRLRNPRLQVPPDHAGLLSERPRRLRRSTKRSPRPGCRRSSIPARRRSGQASAAAWGCA